MKTFDPTKPVQTLGGRKARIVCTDRKGGNYPLLVLIEDQDGEEDYESYTADGRAFLGASDNTMSNLVNVPERTERYHTYRFGAAKGFPAPGLYLGTVDCADSDRARRLATGEWQGVAKVTMIDGQFHSAEVVAA